MVERYCEVLYTLSYVVFFVSQLTQDIQMRNNEAQRESRRRDKMEKELKQAKADLEGKTNEIKNLGSAIERYKADVAKLEQQLKEQRVR